MELNKKINKKIGPSQQILKNEMRKKNNYTKRSKIKNNNGKMRVIIEIKK